MSQHVVTSGEVSLQVRLLGQDDRPTLVLVHGWPDTQDVWSLVAPALAADFRVVTFDLRGMGGSTAPSSRAGYRTSRFVDDLVAILDEVVADGTAVHLVGHDWGSINLWAAALREATDPRLTGRLASFTSISGPSLEQYRHFFVEGIRRRAFRTVLRQASRSWYVLAFQVPLVPELVLRRLGGRLRERLARREGHDAIAPTFVTDAVQGLNLYRVSRARRDVAPTDVPVQLLVPLRDAYVIPAMHQHIGRFATDLTRVDLDAGHWVVRTDPAAVTAQVTAFVHSVESRE